MEDVPNTTNDLKERFDDLLSDIAATLYCALHLRI